MPAAQQAAPWVFHGSALLIVLIPFLFRTTAAFIVNIIGLIYPSFASVVAIQKKDERKVGQWLVYWVIYATLLIVQRCFDPVLSKIPFYNLFNALFLIALMHYPFGDHDTLAQHLYYKILAPNFGKAAVEANEALMEAAGEMKKDPQGFAGALISGNENKSKKEKTMDHLSGLAAAAAEAAKSASESTDGQMDEMEEMLQQLREEVENAAAEGAEKAQEEILEGVDAGMLSQLVQIAENSENDENNNRGPSDDDGSSLTDSASASASATTSGWAVQSNAESAQRINVYKKECGPQNSKKLASSQEVLTLTPSGEDLDVDVGDFDEEVKKDQ